MDIVHNCKVEIDDTYIENHHIDIKPDRTSMHAYRLISPLLYFFCW